MTTRLRSVWASSALGRLEEHSMKTVDLLSLQMLGNLVFFFFHRMLQRWFEFSDSLVVSCSLKLSSVALSIERRAYFDGFHL